MEFKGLISFYFAFGLCFEILFDLDYEAAGLEDADDGDDDDDL